MIPKSVLFVIAEMNTNAENWNLTLLLNPTDKIPLIVIADGVFLLILGLVIIVFHLYEKVSAISTLVYIPFANFEFNLVCVSVSRQKTSVKRTASKRLIISDKHQ